MKVKFVTKNIRRLIVWNDFSTENFSESFKQKVGELDSFFSKELFLEHMKSLPNL